MTGMAQRYYIYLNHFSDQYEVLVEGRTVLRINKYYADSGMSRPVDFDDLTEGLKDAIAREIVKDGNGSYEI